MNRSWRLGNAFGIGLYIHWSFLLLPAFVLYSNLEYGLGSALAGVGLVLAIFGCVVLHELGHALMARTFGIGTRDITLYPIGGAARLERMPEQPLHEILIALAGPAVNVVIAGGLWLGIMLSGQSIGTNYLPHSFMLQVLAANIVLVVFNMIPAFPLDGGRVLRATLGFFMNRVRATEIAVVVSRVLSVGFLLLAFTEYGSMMLVVIAALLYVTGTQELAYVRHRERLAGGPQGPQFVTAPAPANWSGFMWDPRTGMMIQWHNGKPVGANSVGGGGPAP